MSATTDDPIDELEVPDEMLPDGENEFTKDDMFHLLQNERRRDVLRYLQDAEGAVRMRDIAEQVAAWENDTTVQHLSSDERQRVYIALYQTHLPTLDEAGVIDYNQDRGYVEPRPLMEKLESYVDSSSGAEGGEDGRTGALDVTAVTTGVAAVGSVLFAVSQAGILAIPSEILLVGVLAVLVTTVGVDFLDADVLSSTEA